MSLTAMFAAENSNELPLMLMRRERPLYFLQSLFGFNRPRNRRQLIFIIGTHIIGWLLFFSLPILFYNIEIEHPFFLFKEAIDKLLLVAFFYFNYFFLLPGYLERKKPGLYFLFLIAVIALLIIQQVLVERYFFDHIMPRPNFVIGGSFVSNEVSFPSGARTVMFQSPVLDSAGHFPNMPFERKVHFGMPGPFILMALNKVFSSVMLFALLGAFIRLTFTFIKQRDEKKALENATLNAEVNLLKSQVNPHFLFNTLNTIYAQAHAKSGNTEDSIMKLSDILRHVLYESSDKVISLDKDIRYISNYIDLQRMRINSKVDINYKVSGETANFTIAPLLLITFIENAFKYGVSYVQPCTIDIFITLENNSLELQVSNPILNKPQVDEGGIGLKNASRRLELLYPGRYSLDINEQMNTYSVKLKIDLQ